METYNIVKEKSRCLEVLRDILCSDSRSPKLLGLCGGRSVKFAFEILDQLKTNSILEALLIDERMVSIDNPDSNFHLLGGLLGDFAGLSSNLSIHSFKPEDEKGSILEYEEVYLRFGNRFDLIFLGVGEDGHVASIFPGLEQSHASSQKFFVFEGSPKPPSKRMTASHKAIESAKACVLFFLGEGKREAYGRFLDSKINTYDCPAKYALSADRCIVFTDLD